jgi:hypothetical protein
MCSLYRMCSLTIPSWKQWRTTQTLSERGRERERGGREGEGRAREREGGGEGGEGERIYEISSVSVRAKS